VKKKKILFQSDFALAKTGFGRNAKALLSYLYSTGKYEIVHYCCGLQWSTPQLQRTPWKSIGTLPDDEAEVDRLNRDPNQARAASYGAYNLDRVMKQEKPDLYIAVQDIWGIDFALNAEWFKDMNSVLWTTLDSLPILPSAIEAAKKTKNFWIWSDFATKEMHKLGHTHVKTVHGAVEDKSFYRLNDKRRQELRKNFDIPQDAFVVGFVFRNQLRKSVPNLLEGYKRWKDIYKPDKPTRLLLHTHFSEGWNIHRLADEYGIDKSEIITTYVCRNCWQMDVKPFQGQDIQCKICSAPKGLTTTNVSVGVTEDQLNEVYNLMDVYCHPFTSGGQEIPIQEAKLTELITLVTNYSCGEEMCYPEAESLKLEWSEYREHQTEFKKASTDPRSIANNLNKVYNFKPSKVKKMGQAARKWTIDNFSPKSVGKIIEEIADSCDFVNGEIFDKKPKQEKNPHAQIEDIKDNAEWLVALYKEILKREVDREDDGHKYWMQEISKGMKRIDVENYFRQTAAKENSEQAFNKFENFLDEDDKGKRILYVMPESSRDVFLSTSLFKSISESYPDNNLYVATKPELFEILDGNPYVHKTIPYFPQMDNLLWLEGHGNHEGFFEIAFLPHLNTQRLVNYLHNGKDKMVFDVKE
tara:strand:- start:11440 stop:13356 length:1917 start_codon:yes stop_codon:yes gene_type:complete